MKVLRKNGEIVEAGFEEQEGKKAFWHTSAHVLAQAVKRLYPETKCAIGPAIENGFYYDFQFAFPFSEANLKEIEEEMRKIVKESLSVQVRTLQMSAILRLSNYCRLQVHTGEEMSRIRCLRESMGYLFQRHRSWKNICICWKKQRQETIEN